MSDPFPLAAIIAATFLLAGLVKGVTGMGLPTVAAGVLGLMMAPAQAAALLVVPALVTNLWQMAGPGFVPLLWRIWPLLAGIVVGTWAGAGLLDGLSASEARRLLGVALILYAGLAWAAPPLSVPIRAEAWIAVPVGLVTGGITSITGVFVLPAVPFLQALGMSRDMLVRALGLAFTTSTLAMAANLIHTDALSLVIAGQSVLALVPALAGMAAGQWLRGQISAAVFRHCFFLSMLLLGIRLAV